MVTNASTSETSDLYMGIVARPLNNLRIVVCRDGIQWLLQTSDGERGGTKRWKSVSFAATKPGLIKALRHIGGLSGLKAKEVVDALPSRQAVAKTDSSK